MSSDRSSPRGAPPRAPHPLLARQLRRLGLDRPETVPDATRWGEVVSRVAEQVRSGIESLPRGQTNAGLAMGFTLAQVYQFVTLPMAFRIIIPPMTSEFLTIFKNSSTALTIGVLELTAQSRQISEYTFKTFEAFTAATLIYIVITLTVIFFMRAIEKRVAVPGFIAQAGGH
jgi:glutamate/aspartate transport system permease protein